MEELRYMVSNDAEVLAREMRLCDALMFMKAYCETFWAMPVNLRLQVEQPKEGEEDDTD